MSGMSGITSSSGYDNGKCQYTANTCVYGKQSGGQASCGSKELALRRVCACTKKGNIDGKDGDAEAHKDKSGGVTMSGDYGESCVDVCRKRHGMKTRSRAVNNYPKVCSNAPRVNETKVQINHVKLIHRRVLGRTGSAPSVKY